MWCDYVGLCGVIICRPMWRSFMDKNLNRDKKQERITLYGIPDTLDSHGETVLVINDPLDTFDERRD